MDLCKTEVTTVDGGVQIDGSLSERMAYALHIQKYFKIIYRLEYANSNIASSKSLRIPEYDSIIHVYNDIYDFACSAAK